MTQGRKAQRNWRPVWMGAIGGAVVLVVDILLGGSGAVGLPVAVAVGGLIALVSMHMPSLSAREDESPGTQTAVVRGSPGEVLQNIQLAVAGLSRHSAHVSGPETLIFRRRATPGWTVVLAIVLFPIGLLALTYKRDEDYVVAAKALPDGATEVSMRGRARRALLDRIDRALSPPPDN